MLSKRMGVAAASVAAVGAATVSAIASGSPEREVPPDPPRVRAVECIGVRTSGNVIGGTLSDGRTWKVVLNGPQAETERLSPAIEQTLCQVQDPALARVEVREWIAAAKVRDPEKVRAARDRLLTEAARIEATAKVHRDLGTEHAAAYEALAAEMREASRDALVALALAANPTWAADHPGAQPKRAMVASMEKALRSKSSFAQLRERADGPYRVEKIVDRMIGKKPSPLRKRAMHAAMRAWRHHQSDDRIRDLVADIRTKATFADWNRHAPRHDYRRIVIRGGLTNRYTAALLLRAEAYSKSMGGPAKLWITQGSYSTSVSASAGTHDGGGALDISVSGMSSSEIRKAVKALRLAGFAAWHRGPPSFTPHIHAIAIGDRDASPAAKDQVRDYRNGLDGLAYSQPDPDYRYAGRPIPKWA